MKKVLFLVLFILILAVGYLFIYEKRIAFAPNDEITPQAQKTRTPEVLIDTLSVPWGIAELPDGDLLISERTGTLVRAGREGDKQSIPVPDVADTGEGGLLGITLHPRYQENNWVYIYHTTRTQAGVRNQVMRYTFTDNQLTTPHPIITDIPGAAYHDGGRIAFGPDGHLYITTGDSGQEMLAQDRTSLAGKILRVTDTGAIPENNPFSDSPVYSYGHRNPQGLAWDQDGNLWSTEHGRSGIRSGLDELNLITPGTNYGWPVIEGDEMRDGMQTPVLHSGPQTTWAPASLVAYENKLLWGGLRGESIYAAQREGQDVSNLIAHFKEQYGRIRTLFVTTDDMLLFSTSNTDGRGRPEAHDDAIYQLPLEAL